MLHLTPSDLSDLARYPASLRSAARALWGEQLAPARTGASAAAIDRSRKPTDPIAGS